MPDDSYADELAERKLKRDGSLPPGYRDRLVDRVESYANRCNGCYPFLSRGSMACPGRQPAPEEIQANRERLIAQLFLADAAEEDAKNRDK